MINAGNVALLMLLAISLMGGIAIGMMSRGCW